MPRYCDGIGTLLLLFRLSFRLNRKQADDVCRRKRPQDGIYAAAAISIVFYVQISPRALIVLVGLHRMLGGIRRALCVPGGQSRQAKYVDAISAVRVDDRFAPRKA